MTGLASAAGGQAALTGTRDASGYPAPALAAADLPELEAGEVGSGAGGVRTGEFVPQVLAGVLGHVGLDVAEGVPGGLSELDRAGDRISDQPDRAAAGCQHKAQVARGMTRREDRGDARRHGGIGVNRVKPWSRGGAQSLPDVVLHLAGAGDEVVPVVDGLTI